MSAAPERGHAGRPANKEASNDRPDRSRSPHCLGLDFTKDEDFWDGVKVAQQYVEDMRKYLQIQKSIIEFQEQTLTSINVTLDLMLAKKQSEP